MKKVKIAVLVSGGGTNLQAILNAVDDRIITSAEIKVVISNNPNAFALTRAENHGVRGVCINKKEFGGLEFENRLVALLKELEIDLIVLAGFMCILSESFTKTLFEQNEKEESAINAQMYDATINLLRQMKLLLGDVNLSLNEFKNVFKSEK